jgi:hypothetical protein
MAANSILPKRGDESQRLTTTKIAENEIHVSKNNAGDGRSTRCFVRQSQGQDVLVGPFEFVPGTSGRITVSPDYDSGRVVIDYQDAATFSPSSSLTAVASAYSNNSTIEAGDTFTGPHVVAVAKGGGANETLIDRATFEYLGSTFTFASPLQAIDGQTAASGSFSWSQQLTTPADFSLSNVSTRRRSITVRIDPAQGSGFSQSAQTRNFNWGWRLVGFRSTTLFSDTTGLTTQIVANGAVSNQVKQTPTSEFSNVTFTMPADGNFHRLYIAHTCSPDDAGSIYADAFGWTPSAVLVGSGAIGLTEVTDLASGDVLLGSLGGQSATKAYRVWRVGSASGYFGEGQSLTFSFS